MEIPTITTSRLTLRPFTEKDADPLHRILGEEGVLRYFPNSDPPPRDRVQKLIADQLKHWEEHGFGWWAVEPRSKKELIGWSRLGGFKGQGWVGGRIGVMNSRCPIFFFCGGRR